MKMHVGDGLVNELDELNDSMLKLSIIDADFKEDSGDFIKK